MRRVERTSENYRLHNFIISFGTEISIRAQEIPSILNAFQFCRIKYVRGGNNPFMARTLDYVSFTVIVFLLTLVWSGILFAEWVPAIIFSVAFALISAVTLHYITKGRERPYSPDRLATEFGVRGPLYLINLLKSTLKGAPPESGANYIILEDCILFAAFKFGQLTVNDLNGLLTTAVSHDRKTVYVMTRGIERKAFFLLQFYDVRVRIVRIRALYRYLKKHDALPELKPVKRKFSPAALVDAVLQRSNLKNYLFSGCILVAVAFLTPLKIYYLVLGSVSLVLALLTLTPLGRGSGGGDKFFEKLENAPCARNFDESDDDSVSEESTDTATPSAAEKPDDRNTASDTHTPVQDDEKATHDDSTSEAPNDGP